MKVWAVTGMSAIVGAVSGQSTVGVSDADRPVKIEKQLRSDDDRRRWDGVSGAVQLGKPVVPRLLKLLGDWPQDPLPMHVGSACQALMGMGADAVPALPTARAMLTNEESHEVRVLGLELLCVIGPHDPESTKEDLRLIYAQKRGRYAKLGDWSHQLMTRIVRLSEPADLHPTELFEYLKGQSLAHTEMALDRLAWRLHPRSGMTHGLGEQEDLLVQVLRGLATGATVPEFTEYQIRADGEGAAGSGGGGRATEVQYKAARLLRLIRPKEDLPTLAHVALLHSPDPSVRGRATLALGAVGAAATDEVVEALVVAASDPDKLIRWNAITALGMLGPRAISAKRVLQYFVRAGDKATAARSAAALDLIWPQKPR